MNSSTGEISEKPILSVVVLCYNQENFIGECLESIFSQSLDIPFEVIVGDDGSTDNSVAVIETFRTRYPAIVKIVRHETNVGYSRNFSDIIAATTGEYIAYIDGDDLMLPGKLKRQIALLDAYPDYGMVVHKMRTIDSLTKEPVDFPLPRRKPAVFDADYLMEHGPFFFCSSAMFRGALRRRHAVNLKLKVVADIAHLLQSLYGTHAFYLDEELGLYRVNPLGFTSTVIKNPQRHETNIRDMMDTFEMAQGLGMAKDVVDRGRARVYMRSAIVYLEAGHYAEFVNCIESSVRAGKIGTKQGALHVMRHWPHALRRLYAFAKQVAGRRPALA
jgi:glycosyltransferase involved in cell wall biosynthesis